MTSDTRKNAEDLRDEIIRANRILANIIDSLESCNANTNLTRDIGIYARTMPEFKLLTKQKDLCISVIRQICTGETHIQKGILIFRSAEKQFNDALDYINNHLSLQSN